MVYRRRRPRSPWLIWSYSRLRTLFECPPNYWRRYILKKTMPTAPIMVVGAALHYLAKRFFAVKYKSPESFSNAWKHFWLCVTDGQHGPDGYQSPPIDIAWTKWPNERWYWFHQGSTILTDFFERNAFRRNIGLVHLTEKRFRIPDWHGLELNGVVDRVDIIPARRSPTGSPGVRIIDYKMGSTSPDTHQSPFYMLGYTQKLRDQYCDGLPLLSIAVENLFSGHRTELMLWDEIGMRQFLGDLLEASNYVHALVRGEEFPELVRPRLYRLPTQPDGRPVLSQVQPERCQYCPTPNLCERQMRMHPLPDGLQRTVLQWNQKNLDDLRGLMPTQEELAVFDHLQKTR